MTNKKKTGKQLSPPETVGTDYPLESARSRFENANYLAVEDLRAICTTLDKINNIEGVEEDAVFRGWMSPKTPARTRRHGDGGRSYDHSELDGFFAQTQSLNMDRVRLVETKRTVENVAESDSPASVGERLAQHLADDQIVVSPIPDQKDSDDGVRNDGSIDAKFASVLISAPVSVTEVASSSSSRTREHADLSSPVPNNSKFDPNQTVYISQDDHKSDDKCILESSAVSPQGKYVRFSPGRFKSIKGPEGALLLADPCHPLTLIPEAKVEQIEVQQAPLYRSISTQYSPLPIPPTQHELPPRILTAVERARVEYEAQLSQERATALKQLKAALQTGAIAYFEEEKLKISKENYRKRHSFNLEAYHALARQTFALTLKNAQDKFLGIEEVEQYAYTESNSSPVVAGAFLGPMDSRFRSFFEDSHPSRVLNSSISETLIRDVIAQCRIKTMGILERLIELEAKDRLAETQHRVNERRKYWIILTQNDKSAVHALKKQQFLMEKEAELLNYGMNRGYAYDNGQLEDSDSLAPGSIFGRGSLSPDQTGGLSQVQADEATSDAARVVTTFRLMTQKALNIVTENNEKHDVSLSSSKNSATASRGLFSEFNTSNLLHNYNIADIYAWGENADEVGPTSGGTSVASLVQRHTRSSIPESGSSRERRFQSTALLEASTAVSKLQDMSLRAELSLQRQASHGNALETEMWTLQSRIRHVRY